MASLVLFAIVLIIVGGLIAWLGDWLGTRIGKKRLSVFGLRPRHTATLLTIASGVGIALLTLCVLVSYDYGVRRALLHGQQIIHTNRELRKQNLTQQTQIAAGQAQLTVEQVKLADEQAKQKQVVGQLVGSRAALSATQSNLKTTQHQLQEAKSLLSQAQAQSQTAQAQAQTARVQVKNAQARLQRLAQPLKALEIRVRAAQESLIYRTGQEMGRRVIKTAQSPAMVERQLVTFLNDLSEQAIHKRGRIGVNKRAVVIAVPIKLPKTPLPVSKPVTNSASLSPRDLRALEPAEEKAAVRILAQNIAEAHHGTKSVVVVALVAVNSFTGEPTDIVLKPYANVLIYPKDTVVASEILDGTSSEADIISALQAFLTGRVRPAALARGLIPQTDPLTGHPLVGAIDQTTSLALPRQIAQIGGPVRVTAFAAEDVYSVGPLRLHLNVSPVGKL